MEERGFGWVIIGVKVETGEPRLVKEFRIEDENEQKSVYKEAYSALSFGVSPRLTSS